MAESPSLQPPFLEAVQSLHPEPWRRSRFGEHMAAVRDSPRDILPCEEAGRDAKGKLRFPPQEFFQPLDGSEAPRPYFIPQKVWAYTPPPPCEQDSEEALKYYPAALGEALRSGMDLADCLKEAATKPWLLTGHTGTGKTVLVRELFERILRGDSPTLREWRFVWVEGQHLPEAEERKKRYSILFHAIWKAMHPDAQWADCSEEALRETQRLFENATRLLVVLDLNRGDTTAAEELIGEVASNHRPGLRHFVVVYRPQSVLLDRDRIWKRVDPAKGGFFGLEMRELDLDAARGYFRTVRQAHWEKQKGLGAREVQEKVAAETAAFEAFDSEYREFIGRPILLHFATQVADLGAISDLAALYREVIELCFRRRDSTDEDVHRLWFFTASLGLQMTEARFRPGADPEDQGLALRLPEAAGAVSQLFERARMPPEGAPEAWKEHFASSRYRTLHVLLRDKCEYGGLDPAEAVRFVLDHSVLRREGGSLRLLHDSMAYFFSAWILVHPEGPPLDHAPARPGEAALKRIGEVLRLDPVFWYLRAEFIGRLLDVAALHRLVFTELLGSEEMAWPRSPLEDRPEAEREEAQKQYLILFLAARLTLSLGSETPGGEPPAPELKDLLRLRGFPVPQRLSADWPTIRDHLGAVLQGEKRAAKPIPYWAWELGKEQPETWRSDPGAPAELVELGEDPDTKHAEYADPRTGVVPVRDAERRLVLREDAAIVYVELPGGEFLMGSPEDEPGREADEVLHRVRVSGFLLAKHLLTRAQHCAVRRLFRKEVEDGKGERLRERYLEAVRGLHPEDLRGDGRAVLATGMAAAEAAWSLWMQDASVLRGLFRGPGRLPQDAVSWFDAVLTSVLLDARLPAEAEWEYAARGGSGAHLGPALDLREAACFAGNSFWRPCEVASFPANGFGLHDTLGNLLEWCADAYDPGFYARCAKAGGVMDPLCLEGPTYRVGDWLGPLRVLRGGSWGHDARDCRSAGRGRGAAAGRGGLAGFRPARLLAP